MSAQAMVRTFDFEASPVRVVMVDDAPWWVAGDLAAALGYRAANAMTRMLEDDQLHTHLVCTNAGERKMTIVTEGGMWTCVIRSKRPEAQRFTRWLTDVVLPALRQTGEFKMTVPMIDVPEEMRADTPDANIRLGLALQVVREARKTFGSSAAQRAWHQLRDMGLPDVAEDVYQAGIVNDDRFDSINRWLDVRTERMPGCKTGSSVLYHDYLDFARGQDWVIHTLTSFGRYLERVGFGKVKAGPMFRVGIRLRRDVLAA